MYLLFSDWQITVGELTLEDYDFALCHVDMLSNITNLRKYMKDAFPNKARGNVLGVFLFRFVCFKCLFKVHLFYVLDKIDHKVSQYVRKNAMLYFSIHTFSST